MIGRRRSGRRGDSGFGLVELMVSMSIFALIMGVVISLLITAQKQTASTAIRLDDIDEARMAIDSLSRTIRTAVEPAQLQIGCTTCTTVSNDTAVKSAQPLSIQFYANRGSAAGPSLVTFAASFDTVRQQGVLIKTVQLPDLGSAPNFAYTPCAPGPGCLISAVPIVRGLRWPVVGALFTYYDNTGTEVVPPTNASLVREDLFKIDAIAINLTVQTRNKFKTGPTSIYSRVGLPNSGSGVVPTSTPTP